MYLTMAYTDVAVNNVMSSTDGSSWTLSSVSGVNFVLGLAYANGVFVAVGNSQPTGYVAVGAISCVCDPGSYLIFSTCVPCPAGSYCGSAGLSAVTGTCAVGQVEKMTVIILSLKVF